MEPPLKVGSKVELIDKNLYGTVAYIGSTQFQPGKWVGVVLDEPKGKNNGAVQGKEYFKCEENYGLFVRPTQLKLASKGDGSEKSSESMSSSVDEKSSSSRLPQSGVKKMKLPLSKGENESKLKQPLGQKVGSKNSTTMARSTDKLTTSTTTAKLPPGSTKTGVDKAKSPSPDEENNNNNNGDKTATRKNSSGVVGTKRPSLANLAASRMSVSSITSTVPGSPGGSSVAQQVARINQDLDKGVGEGIIKNVNTVLETLNEGAQVEYLRSEYKDCAEKLETLRLKRQEDKQKLIDYEKCKIQLHQMIEYKTKMTELHGELQRQLQMAKKEAKEAIEARENYQDEMSGLAESVEMATLDKEVAEERAELLQTEVETLKEKVQELEMDLELLKNEMSEKGNEAGVVNSVQLKQLEQQNERLKEAVVKMRDLSAHERKEHQKAAKELEVLRQQVAELTKKNDKLTSELLQYEQQLSELTEQVDAALGSEEVVEELTAKNLALEEKVQQLEESMEDFEQMRLMDEELQESNREMEKELKQELEEARFKMNELKNQLKKSQDQSSDYEQTILKFRQLTGKYQTQIQDMKDKLLIRDDENKTSTEMISSSENGNTILSPSGRYNIFSQTKAWSEVVDNELRKLELENALQHVRYLRSFLPDNYSKPGGDNDCVMLSLLFPRLSAKVCLLISQLNDLYPHVPGGMKREHVVKSHKAEQWSFVYKMTFYLNGLLTIFRKFDSVINKCSVERLAKLAQLQPELLAQERLIDFYFDLLKNSRLDENVSLENVDKMLNYFQNFYSVHLNTEEFDSTHYANDSIKRIFSALAWLKAEILRSKFYLMENDTKIELIRFFDDLNTFINESESTLFRLKTIVPLDTKQKTLVFDSEVCDLFLDSCVQAEKCAKLLHEACKSASNQVSMMPDIEGIESHSFEEMLQNACLILSGKGGEKMNFDDFTKLSMGLLMNRLAKLIEIVDKNSYDTPVDKEKPHFPAILERAHARKLDSVEAESLRWQLDKKDNEVKDLKLALRSKAEEISEMRVRKEMAESRLHTTGKEGDERIVRLQKQMEEMTTDLKKKEAENDKIMDSLQKEIEALEKENDDLKDRYKLLAKKSLLQGISAHGAFDTLNKISQGGPSGVAAPPPDLAYLAQRLDELKSAYLRANAEKCRLQGRRMYETMLVNLPPLKVPKKSPSAATTTGTTRQDFDQSSSMILHHKRHDELSQLSRESAKLQKEYLHNVAVAKVIDITKKRSDSVCYKRTPAYAYFAYLENVKKLSEWFKTLQFRILKLRKTKSQENRDYNHQKRYSFLVGRIVVNKNADDKAEIVKISITPEQFRILHEKLAN